jgi:hypothetical protein
MTTFPSTAEITGPQSLIEGVEQAVVEILGITGLGHRSALRHISVFDGTILVEAVHRTILGNYVRGGASANKDRSTENWRWPILQPQIGIRNLSPEVVIERAIAAACVRLGRKDWSNQIPVASGLIAGARDRRRAIDLVRCRGERHFELIELKTASNTPLYAAIEIIIYGCLWLLAREDKPLRGSALLEGDRIDLRVLATAAFYSWFVLKDIEEALDTGIRALGQSTGVAMSFAFELLDDRIRSDAIPGDELLLACLDHSKSATTAGGK